MDELAAWIARLFLDQVNAYRSESGKRVWPGLYNIDFKIFANITGATPDGRKFRGRHWGTLQPHPRRGHKGPTAVVESCLPAAYAGGVCLLSAAPDPEQERLCHGRGKGGHCGTADPRL